MKNALTFLEGEQFRRSGLSVVPAANKSLSPSGAAYAEPFSDDAAPVRSLGSLWGCDSTKMPALTSLAPGRWFERFSIQGFPRPLKAIQGIFKKYFFIFRLALSNLRNGTRPSAVPNLTGQSRPKADRFKPMQGKKFRLQRQSGRLSCRIVSPAALAHHPAMSRPSASFLTAEWRWLAMLNYEVDPHILAPYVPAGTELDFWNGKTYLSLVGFLFQECRVRGIAIPFHRHFEEVNLRFYVRHQTDDGWRRGVVFIKELVPRWAIAYVARTFYNENYFVLPMSHRIETLPDEAKAVSYSWRFQRRENWMKVTTRGTPQQPAEGSQPEFITEHYWGYARQRDGSTMEYRVEHPRWQIWETASAGVQCDVANLYGKEFCEFLDRQPASAFLADGSEVKVCHGVKLKR